MQVCVQTKLKGDTVGNMLQRYRYNTLNGAASLTKEKYSRLVMFYKIEHKKVTIPKDIK